jgi:hypothetical protein
MQIKIWARRTVGMFVNLCFLGGSWIAVRPPGWCRFHARARAGAGLTRLCVR